MENSTFQIQNPGFQNFNSGPDFTEAKIRTENTTWVGNVEIHVKSSDWYIHGHHLDKAYNSVILQVTTIHDKQVLTENGRVIPVIEIEIDESIFKKYIEFKSGYNFIPCAKDIEHVDDIKMQLWLGNVLIERLIEKSNEISTVLDQNKKNWEETFYQLMARSFGFKVNADPFEWLAKSLPLKYLAKHKTNILQLEALLFGQAGFLAENLPNSNYYTSLKKEYEFLRIKYQLKPIEKHVWKFMRIRPSNFPTIRISQFANLIYKSNALFSKILEANSVQMINEFFQVEAFDYWNKHFLFEKESSFRKKVMGAQSIEILIINTVVPMLFVYGSSIGDESIKERAISFLDAMKPEKNAILLNWKKIGIKIHSALYSQALLQLKKSYCSNSRCLECVVGTEILRNQFETSQLSKLVKSAK